MPPGHFIWGHKTSDRHLMDKGKGKLHTLSLLTAAWLVLYQAFSSCRRSERLSRLRYRVSLLLVCTEQQCCLSSTNSESCGTQKIILYFTCCRFPFSFLFSTLLFTEIEMYLKMMNTHYLSLPANVHLREHNSAIP